MRPPDHRPRTIRREAGPFARPVPSFLATPNMRPKPPTDRGDSRLGCLATIGFCAAFYGVVWFLITHGMHHVR